MSENTEAKRYLNAKATLAALEQLKAEGFPVLDQTIRTAAMRAHEARARMKSAQRVG